MTNAIATAGSALLGILLLSTSANAQATTDGTTTFEPAVTTGAPTYPPLPPNSADLVYDADASVSSSRNIQNADINPGWPYWAHQVRFTPTAAMQGTLLEVRYVAAFQWGSASDFDLVIRDGSGAVVTSMTNVSAVIDADNWQVLDVSSLNFVPASLASDFYVELQPTNQCGGTNGFTIAYSTIGSARSSFTSDCNNPFPSFTVESRDLYIRAVVGLDPPGGTGTPYCLGDGTGAFCPCANFGATGAGCSNSNGAGSGSLLVGSGTASLSNDTFSLTITGSPSAKPGLILRGQNQLAGNPVGDGLLCTSGNTARSQVQVTSAGGATTFTMFNGAGFGASSYGAGSTTNYQFWHRDPTGGPCGGGFNFSNALAVGWTN